MSATEQTQTAAVLAARAEASAWITRLHGPNRTPEMEAGLRRWLAERPENRAEFEALTELWDLVAAGVPARGVPRLERWERGEVAREVRQRPASPWLWATAALVLVVCGAVALFTYPSWRTPVYATQIGEQRVTQLPDGTRISLNSNSRLKAVYNDAGRRLVLERGEVLFEVAPDPQRPFMVEAGPHRIRALGTSFVVRRDGDLTSVTLVTGKVAVLNEGEGENEKAIELNPGQRLTLAGNSAPRLDTPRLEAVTAWRRGEVLLDDTPLAAAVEEMNRYDATRISIDDPEIADLIVSGLYHTGDSEGFARSVARMYGLQVVEDRGRIHLRKPSSP